MSQSEIKTTRLLLRQWNDLDFPKFAAMNADARVMEFMPKLLDRAESDALAGRIEEFLQQHRFGFWAVEVPGVTRFAGFVGLSIPRFQTHFTPCVEVGWRLAHEQWGHGYATEAAGAAIDFGFTRAALGEIVSFTVPGNLRSRRVMDKLGMTHSSADDFDHPILAEGHRLRRHVLYRLQHVDWEEGHKPVKRSGEIAFNHCCIS